VGTGQGVRVRNVSVDCPIPYYIYDGYEEIPIRLKSEWRDKAEGHQKDWDFCDEHGWSSKAGGLRSRLTLWGSTKMYNELKRLSKLWDEYVSK
jgi:hypothetical protein